MTDILARLKELKDKKAELERELAKIQKDFEVYISDKSIPLGERWAIFSKSPDELNEHNEYFIQANTAGLQYILDNWFDAPEVYGRGKRIKTKDLFEDTFKDSKLEYNPEHHDEKEIAFYKEAMEDILSQNCGSFCYDW